MQAFIIFVLLIATQNRNQLFCIAIGYLIGKGITKVQFLYNYN